MREYSFIDSKILAKITSEDILSSAFIVFSLYIKEPEFQGQTKDKLTNSNISKFIVPSLSDMFAHFLAENKNEADILINNFIDNSVCRINNKKNKAISRSSVTNKLRLPGKLTDCISMDIEHTELFIVEGDSAGGTAKQARNRDTQAILPLRGKILNVASSSDMKIQANKELSDLLLVLGGTNGREYDYSKLRYGKIIIMTDADVDGAHIASLLMTFFLYKTPDIIKNGNLFIAVPPLYKIVSGTKQFYIKDEKEKDKILKS